MLRHQPACRRATSPYFRPLITRKIEDPVSLDLEPVAQTIHGLDQVLSEEGLVFHESQGGTGVPVLTDSEAHEAIQRELRRLGSLAGER